MESAGPGTPAPLSPSPFGSGLGAEVLGTSPVGLPVLFVYGIYRVVEVTSKTAALADRTPIVERELRASRGMLSVDLAKAAAETLQHHAGRTVHLVDGYVRLPGVAEKASPTEAMNEMNRQIKTWYRE
jgi:hypothetical protein